MKCLKGLVSYLYVQVRCFIDLSVTPSLLSLSSAVLVSLLPSFCPIPPSVLCHYCCFLSLSSSLPSPSSSVPSVYFLIALSLSLISFHRSSLCLLLRRYFLHPFSIRIPLLRTQCCVSTIELSLFF